MISLLFLGFLLHIAAFDNIEDPRVRDAYEMIMQKYEHDSGPTIIEAADHEYRSQFNDDKHPAKDEVVPYDVILKQYQDYSDTMMKKAGGVVHRSLNDLSQNPNGEFYVWNESSQIWQLPHRPAPTTPVDGAAVNSRILSSKIQLSLQKELSEKESGIKKRGFPNPFNYFKSAGTVTLPHKVLDPNDIKLGWWRATFGRARMKTAFKLFFKPKIVQIYFSIAGIGYLYFICRYFFGNLWGNTNEGRSEYLQESEDIIS